jgi:hypothetical protein
LLALLGDLSLALLLGRGKEALLLAALHLLLALLRDLSLALLRFLLLAPFKQPLCLVSISLFFVSIYTRINTCPTSVTTTSAFTSSKDIRRAM